MQRTLEDIGEILSSDISSSLSRCGLMFRIFHRVKSESSTRHKLQFKYADKKVRLQDMIGIRIVVYFQDDVDLLALYYSVGDVVKKAIDEFDTSTFRPQRLNITSRIPEDMVELVESYFADLYDQEEEIADKRSSKNSKGGKKNQRKEEIIWNRPII